MNTVFACTSLNSANSVSLDSRLRGNDDVVPAAIVNNWYQTAFTCVMIVCETSSMLPVTSN
jgi:hypothetical protein